MNKRLEDAFREYVDGSRSRLYRFAYLLTGRRADAEDLVQDALAKLYLRWRSVTKARSTDPYVQKMIKNGFIDLARSADSRHVDRYAEVPEDKFDESASVAEIVARADLLRRMLDALPPIERTAVVARYFHEMPLAQVADLIGYSESQTNRYLRSALDHMKRVARSEEA